MYTTNGPKVPSSSHSSGHRVLLVPRAEAQQRLPASSQGREGDELIALGIAEIIAGTCSMCWCVHMHLPYISEGAHLVKAAEQSYSERVKRWWLQFVCSKVLPGSSIPHVCYCENKYGHFISTAAWAPMCWNVQQLLRRVPSQTDRSVHNAIRHSCTKKS